MYDNSNNRRSVPVWFTTHPVALRNDGSTDWNWSNSVTGFFVQAVRDLRAFFGMEPTPKKRLEFNPNGFALNLGINPVLETRHIPNAPKVPVNVVMESFDWSQIIARANSYASPHWEVDFIIRFGQGHPQEGQIIFEGTVQIEFEAEFPTKPPQARIKPNPQTPWYNQPGNNGLGMHGNHMFQDGWFCLFQGNNQWNPQSGKQSTIATFLLVVIDWLVWFHLRPGGAEQRNQQRRNRW